MASEPGAAENLGSMLAALRARAPGEAAHYSSEQARLAIRPGPGGGGEVRSSPDGRFHAICDGEVFNKAALAGRLRGGSAPHGASATELLLQLFAAEGVDGLRQVDGQFVIAIWDSFERKLCVIRDFLGVIPAFYAAGPHGVAFASEIKALIRHPRIGKSYDLVSVSNYLTLLTVPGPATLFAGVSKLAPGHCATFDLTGRTTLARYWDLLDSPIAERSDASFYIERVSELHRAAVDRRMPDGPVGALLSGGNDSSANVALLAKRAPPGTVNTFTVGLAEVEGDPGHSDLAYARKVAQFVGSKHREHLMSTEEFLRAIPLVATQLDDLVSEPSSVFLQRALQLARESGIVTIITGEANDELCCGHGEMLDIRNGFYRRWLPYLRKPIFVRQLLAAAAPYLFPDRADILTRAARNQEYFWSFEIGWPDSEKARILSREASRILGGTSSAEAILRCRDRFSRSAHAGRDYLSYIVYAMMQDFYFGNLMLGKLDLLARSLGLDARCPYTEPTYAHFVYNIPAALKTHGGTVKWFFKKAIEGLLPNEIIYRPKQGFRTPVVELFKGRLGDWAQPYLLDGGFTTEGIVERRHVASLLKQHRAGKGDFSNKLWTVMALNLWYEQWLSAARSTPSAA